MYSSHIIHIPPESVNHKYLLDYLIYKNKAVSNYAT